MRQSIPIAFITVLFIVVSTTVKIPQWQSLKELSIHSTLGSKQNGIVTKSHPNDLNPNDRQHENLHDHNSILDLTRNPRNQNCSRRTGDGIVFVHIPKTAGSTLKGILNTYALDHNLTALPYPTLAELKKRGYTTENMNYWDVIPGHYRISIKEFLPKKYRYLVIFRDPVDILVSIYYYFFQSKAKTFPEFLRRMRDDDDVTGGKPVFNTQCKWFGIKEFLNNKQLKAATNRVIASFDWVSVTDMFSESLLLLRDEFGIDKINYISKNVVKMRPRTITIPDDLKEFVAEHTKCDKLLYSKAKTVLRKKLQEAYGENLTSEMKLFEMKQTDESCGRHNVQGQCAYTLDQLGKPALISHEKHVFHIAGNMPSQLLSFAQWFTSHRSLVMRQPKDREYPQYFHENALPWNLLVAKAPLDYVKSSCLDWRVRSYLYIPHPIWTAYEAFRESQGGKANENDFAQFISDRGKEGVVPGASIFNQTCRALLEGNPDKYLDVEKAKAVLGKADWIGSAASPRKTIDLLVSMTSPDAGQYRSSLMQMIENENLLVLKIPQSIADIIRQASSCDFDVYDVAEDLLSAR